MSRPKNADSQATWNTIIEAAQGLMLTGEVSPDAVSLRDVASRAGISVGTLSYYFKTKEELWEACLDGYYERLNAKTAELLTILSSVELTLSQRIDAGVRGIYRFSLAERVPLRLRRVSNAYRGSLHPSRQLHVLGPTLDGVTSALEALLENAPNDIRLCVQSMTFVVMRYVLLSDAELMVVTGLDSVEHAHQAVEDHVAAAALRMVCADPV